MIFIYLCPYTSSYFSFPLWSSFYWPTCIFFPNICPVNIQNSIFLFFLSSIHDCFDFFVVFVFVFSMFFFFSLLLSYVFADGELKFNYFIVEVKSCFQDSIYSKIIPFSMALFSKHIWNIVTILIEPDMTLSTVVFHWALSNSGFGTMLLKPVTSWLCS